MSWLKVDDGFAMHPKILSAGPEGIALHIAAMCYCARYETDGLFPWSLVATLTPLVSEPYAVAERLVALRLWERPSADQGAVHDWLAYNISKERNAHRRAQDAKRQEEQRERDRKAREARERKKAARRAKKDRQVSHILTYPVSHGVTAPVSHGVTSDPTRPDPTRPDQIPSQPSHRR